MKKVMAQCPLQKKKKKKFRGVFKSKNLKNIFMFECVKRVQLQGCLLSGLTLVPLRAQMHFEHNKREGKVIQMSVLGVLKHKYR